jgi:fatty-acyl-CoA synthase
MNIGQLLTHRSFLSPKKEGFVGRKRYTFAEMNERVNRFAAFLQNMGIKLGDRMGLLCKNNEEFVTAFFAAAKIGVITIPINWRFNSDEVEYILQDSGATIVIYDRDFSNIIDEIKERISLIMCLPADEIEDRSAFFSKEEPMVISSGEDVILFMYTSGTTGKPKGAMISHQNLYSASVGIITTVDWWYQDRFLSVAPFFHIGGFMPMIANVHVGATTILMEEFHPQRVWETIEREHITTMMSVPAMLSFMLTCFDQKPFRITSLRNITCGASAVPPKLIQVYEELGIQIQQVYGITEYTGAVSFWRKEMDEQKFHSMGKTVFGGQIKIVDPESGQELPTGEVGEIVCFGPQVFKGYWNNPDATKNVLKNGWYHSGDLGKIDEDGFLYVIDRLKDMIISGGENIYSAELEAVINTIPGVVEVAVVGIPDPQWGEIPKAFIVKRENVDLTKEYVIQTCKKYLAGYKSVKEVEFVDQLPRNAVGKILKHVLKKKHEMEAL